MKHILGIAEILQTADCKLYSILLDLWGCVHDGTSMYPHAKACLEEFRKRNIKVLLLSNAPRRAAKAEVVLNALGVSRDLYHGILTSGEEGYQRLADGRWQVTAQRSSSEAVAHKSIMAATCSRTGGGRYFFIGPARDADVLHGLPYTPAPLEEADFILNVGFGSEAEDERAWDATLRAALTRGLPMLCLNPDMEVVKISGERFPCAGVIAKQYAELGGRVEYIGKPHAAVYTRALAMLGAKPEEVLAIGDGLHTDILGANRAGIQSVLITGGILKQELPDLREATVRGYCEAQGVLPDYLVGELRW